eukprot:gene10585-3103_t
MNFLKTTTKFLSKRNYAKKNFKRDKVTDDLLLCILSYLRPSEIPVLKKTKETIRKQEELEKLVLAQQSAIQIAAEYQKELYKKYMIAAMNAIPEPLKKEALKVDFTPTPMGLFGNPKETPPIPDFKVEGDEEDFEQ